MLRHFWKLRCRKSARRCGAKHISKSKCTKHYMFVPLLEVQMSKKCTPLWREAHFEVKMLKTPEVRTTFGRSDVVSRGRRKGLCTFSKVSKTCGFCSIFQNDGTRGTFEEDLKRCIFRGMRITRDMFIRDVRRSGPCSTSYDLASIFRGRHNNLDRWGQVEWKNRKTHWYEAVSSALNFPFLNEVSQNCFVFDVVKFEK